MEIQNKNDDIKLKAWKRVDERHKYVILFAGVDENGDIPDDPTD